MGSTSISLAGEDERITTLENEVKSLHQEIDQLTRINTSQSSGGLALPKLKIFGFGHFQYEAMNNENGFTLGDFDLFITSRIAKNFSFLSESVVEFEQSGTNVIDIERLMLKYEASNLLNIAVGRGHTAIGYWNRTFHHGAWLQTTIDRPALFEFEDDGGILPSHFVGIEFSGSANNDWGLFSYVVQLSNGRGQDVTDIQLVSDVDDHKQLNFYLNYSPKFISGLAIGGNFLFDEIPDDAAVGRTVGTHEIIAGGHLNYTDSHIEFLSEFITIQHNANTHFSHLGGYVQLGYKFSQWIPYYRFDLLNIDTGDTFFPGASDIDQHTIGIRYDWFTYAAIKVEYRNLESPQSMRHAGIAQISFAF